MKLFFPAVLFCLTTFGLNAQKVESSQEYEDSYLADRIEIMLGESVSLSDDELLNKIKSLPQSEGFLSLEKRFPRAVSLNKKHTPQGERLADISKLYTIRLAEGFSVSGAIAVLKKLPEIRFAEPHFVPQPCYVPNDDSIGVQYALARINAFAAWDIQKGDSTVIIGITDTGFEATHPDLNANIQLNRADPINGIDDDSDGYTDNYAGWDTGENDNDPAASGNYHGLHVTGLCCATTNNATGMAGTGFNSRYLPVKIANSEGALSGAYEGLIYAADHGCQIINCSWGGNQYSDINQELIRYAAINKNCVVVCGAGNYNNEQLFYPAAYPYALSIGSTDSRDSKADFSNFGYFVDLMAPGYLVLSTWSHGTYVKSGGTSMSAPIVSGAAALIKASFPQWNSRQIMEQLKNSSDPVDTLAINSDWKEKMGSGRLNMLKALSQNGIPAPVLTEIQVESSGTGLFMPGDTVEISGILVNYLSKANQVTLTLITENSHVNILNPEITLGAIPTLGSVSLHGNPFRFIIDQDAEINETILFQLDIRTEKSDKKQLFSVPVNLDFINVSTGEIKASFRSDGSAGPTGAGFIQGYGFQYKGNQLLFEGGLMIGSLNKGMADNIRGTGNEPQRLFTEHILRKRLLPTEETAEYNGSFKSENSGIIISAAQRVVFSHSPLYRKFIISEYEITNQSDETYENLYAGIFTDWDIANAYNNRAGWNAELNTGYVYSLPDDSIYAATQLLGNIAANYYAIDNIPGGAGGLDLSDGFSDEEKYRSLSENRLQAGSGQNGNDVITILAGGPFNLPAGEKIRIAFAFHANSSIQDLLYSSRAAAAFYEQQVIPLDAGNINDKQVFYIYPNPSDCDFYIGGAGENIETIRITDIQGRPIPNRFERQSDRWHIHLNEPYRGIIVAEIITKTGKYYKRILASGNQ